MTQYTVTWGQSRDWHSVQSPHISLVCCRPTLLYQSQSPVAPRFFLRSGRVAPGTCRGLGEAPRTQSRGHPAKARAGVGGAGAREGRLAAASIGGHPTSQLPQEG